MIPRENYCNSCLLIRNHKIIILPCCKKTICRYCIREYPVICKYCCKKLSNDLLFYYGVISLREYKLKNYSLPIEIGHDFGAIFRILHNFLKKLLEKEILVKKNCKKIFRTFSKNLDTDLVRRNFVSQVHDKFPWLMVLTESVEISKSEIINIDFLLLQINEIQNYLDRYSELSHLSSYIFISSRIIKMIIEINFMKIRREKNKLAKFSSKKQSDSRLRVAYEVIEEIFDKLVVFYLNRCSDLKHKSRIVTEIYADQWKFYNDYSQMDPEFTFEELKRIYNFHNSLLLLKGDMEVNEEKFPKQIDIIDNILNILDFVRTKFKFSSIWKRVRENLLIIQDRSYILYNENYIHRFLQLYYSMMKLQDRLPERLEFENELKEFYIDLELSKNLISFQIDICKLQIDLFIPFLLKDIAPIISKSIWLIGDDCQDLRDFNFNNFPDFDFKEVVERNMKKFYDSISEILMKNELEMLENSIFSEKSQEDLDILDKKNITKFSPSSLFVKETRRLMKIFQFLENIYKILMTIDVTRQKI